MPERPETKNAVIFVNFICPETKKSCVGTKANLNSMENTIETLGCAWCSNSHELNLAECQTFQTQLEAIEAAKK